MININNAAIKNLIDLVLQRDIFYNNNMQFLYPNNLNQMSFLQRKRNLDNQNVNYNEQISLQKDNNLGREYLENFGPKIFDCTQGINQGINPNFNNDNNSNLKNLELNPKSSLININNVNFNLNGNQYNDSLYNKLNIENFKEIVNDNINKTNNENINENINSTDNSNSAHPVKDKPKKKNQFFNVIHTKKPKKKSMKKKINQTENNNEIKVLKNNKVVYVNTFLLNSYSTSKNIKKMDKIAFIGRNKRSSRYRGVSKNGNQWQVLMMINKNKSYIGSYPSEELAARIYDILALKSRGINARTNFVYNSRQIKNIREMDIDIKSKNIYELISQLIK